MSTLDGVNIEYLLTPGDTGEFSGWTAPGWYFWDEIDANCYGPYASKEIAQIAAEQYFKQLG